MAERECRLHVYANGLLGNGLDVVISSMVYGKVTGCNMSYSFTFGATKRRITVWDEAWPMSRLTIAPSPYAHQLDRAPANLPYVCWRPRSNVSHAGSGCDKRLQLVCRVGFIQHCNDTYASPESGLTVFSGRYAAVTSYTAFMPPNISHAHFLRLYARMARAVRISTSVSGPFHNLSYPSACLGSRMVGAHLRTGRTTHDLKCSTHRGKEDQC
eukprot:5840848-Prymnesium_polylepis.1